jgi:hypothetical protein
VDRNPRTLFYLANTHKDAERWAEFWMELAYLAYDQRRFGEAMGYGLLAADKVPPPTALWREPNKYSDQPPRLVSFCLEHLGDAAGALAWALKAKTAIGVPDQEWDARIDALERLNSVHPGLAPGPRVPRLALFRPGSIGDILMTLNLVPALRAKYPGYLIHYFCLPAIGE